MGKYRRFQRKSGEIFVHSPVLRRIMSDTPLEEVVALTREDSRRAHRRYWAKEQERRKKRADGKRKHFAELRRHEERQRRNQEYDKRDTDEEDYTDKDPLQD